MKIETNTFVGVNKGKRAKVRVSIVIRTQLLKHVIIYEYILRRFMKIQINLYGRESVNCSICTRGWFGYECQIKLLWKVGESEKLSRVNPGRGFNGRVGPKLEINLLDCLEKILIYMGETFTSSKISY